MREYLDDPPCDARKVSYRKDVRIAWQHSVLQRIASEINADEMGILKINRVHLMRNRAIREPPAVEKDLFHVSREATPNEITLVKVHLV